MYVQNLTLDEQDVITPSYVHIISSLIHYQMFLYDHIKYLYI